MRKYKLSVVFRTFDNHNNIFYSRFIFSKFKKRLCKLKSKIVYREPAQKLKKQGFSTLTKNKGFRHSQTAKKTRVFDTHKQLKKNPRVFKNKCFRHAQKNKGFRLTNSWLEKVFDTHKQLKKNPRVFDTHKQLKKKPRVFTTEKTDFPAVCECRKPLFFLATRRWRFLSYELDGKHLFISTVSRC